MTWHHKEPEHQLPWYWPNSLRTLWFQLQSIFSHWVAYSNKLHYTNHTCMYICTMTNAIIYLPFPKTSKLALTYLAHWGWNKMTNLCNCYIQIHFLCNKLSNFDLFPSVQLMIIDIQIKYGLPYCVTCPSMSTDPGSLNPGTRRSRVPGWWDPGIRTNTGAGDTVLAKHT